jgi:hypothetical protein
MTQIPENVGAKSGPGDFYVHDTRCTSCRVPQAIAPDLAIPAH